MQPTNLCCVPWWPPARAVKWSRCSPTSSGPGTSADDGTMRMDFTGCQEHCKRNQRELRVKLLRMKWTSLSTTKSYLCLHNCTYHYHLDQKDRKWRLLTATSFLAQYMNSVHVQCICTVHIPRTCMYIQVCALYMYRYMYMYCIYMYNVHVHTLYMKCSCSPNKMSKFTNQEGSSSVPNFVYLYLLSSDQTAGRHLVLHDVHVLHKRMGFWMLHFVYWKPVRPLPSYVTSHRSE